MIKSEIWPNTPFTSDSMPDMSLRAWFAGLAMQAIIIGYYCGGHVGNSPEHVTHLASDYADALIVALREKA